MCIEQISSELRICPCGCGQSFPIFSGSLRYNPEQIALFKAAHMQHCDSGPHIWLLIGSGPWFNGDERDCWVTLHLWVKEAEVITRIEDPNESPFWPSHSDEERYLTREEVLSQDGGKEWAINRRLDFEKHHEETAAFINETARA